MVPIQIRSTLLCSRNQQPSTSPIVAVSRAQPLSFALINSSITKLVCSSTVKTASALVTTLTNLENILVRMVWSWTPWRGITWKVAKHTSGARGAWQPVLQLQLIARISNADSIIGIEPVWKELGWSHVRRFLTDIGPENTSLIKDLGILFSDASHSSSRCTLLLR